MIKYLNTPITPSFMAHKNGANQSNVGPSDTKITFGTTEWNIGSCYDAANSKFTPMRTGVWLMNIVLHIPTSAAGKVYWLVLYKNGSYVKQFAQTHSGIAGDIMVCGVTHINVTNPTDYYEVYLATTDSSRTVNGDQSVTYIECHLVS